VPRLDHSLDLKEFIQGSHGILRRNPLEVPEDERIKKKENFIMKKNEENQNKKKYLKEEKKVTRLKP